jgi:hypothetical protein
MKRVVLWIGIAITGLAVVGCNNGGFKDDGVPKSFTTQATDAHTLAVSVDGNFDKLSSNQQATFLDMAHGDPGQAKSLCYMMAHPPNEAMKMRAKMMAAGPPNGGPVPGPH